MCGDMVCMYRDMYILVLIFPYNLEKKLLLAFSSLIFFYFLRLFPCCLFGALHSGDGNVTTKYYFQ